MNTLTRLYGKFFTISIILSPILNMYGMSEKINTFTYREIVMIIMSILGLIIVYGGNLKLIFDNKYLFIIIYVLIIIISVSVNIFYGNVTSILRVVRYLLILFYVFYFSKHFFDYKLAFKVYRFMVIIATLFIFAQVISANLFSYDLKGFISFLPLRSQDLSISNGLLRYYSIFEEPGYYGMIVSGFLIIALFKHRISIGLIVLIGLASFLSTATTAIVLFIVSIIFYLIFQLVNINKNQVRKILLLLILLAGLIGTFYIFTLLPQYQYVMIRINNGVSVFRRFEGYYTIFDDIRNFNFLQVLFGNGMSSYSISGYASVFIAFGMFGLMTILMMFFHFFTQVSITSKILILVFLIINIGNVEFFGNASTLLIFTSFILVDFKKEGIYK